MLEGTTLICLVLITITFPQSMGEHWMRNTFRVII